MQEGMVNGVLRVERLPDRWPVAAAAVGLSDVLALVVEQGQKLSWVWGGAGLGKSCGGLRWPPL